MSDLPVVVTPDGTERKLGFNPEQREKPVAFSPLMREVEVPDFPDSEMVPFDLAKVASFRYRIKDQFAEGACTGFGMASCMERMLWQAGYGDIVLSPWFLYAIECNGVDRGGYLDSVCRIATETGTCEDHFVPPRTINPRKLPRTAWDDAANWKVELTVALPKTWRQLTSCVNARWMIYHSLHADSGINTLDSTGTPGNKPGPHNHAVSTGFGLKQTSRWGWQTKMANSWSEKWGNKGYCWLAEKNIAGSYGQFIAIVSVKVKRDLNPPEVDD
jgi:hypothetical protein